MQLHPALHSAHPEVLANEKAALPAHYYSFTSAEAKFRVAADVARAVRETYGYTALAAGVVGSQLRGMDAEDSDTDVMVVVAEKPRHKHHKTLIINTAASETRSVGNVDTTIHSLGEFTTKLSTSVPMLEFLFSPFLMVHPHYEAYFSHLRPGVLSMHKASRRYVGHLVHRKANRANPIKTARNAVSTLYNMDRLGTALAGTALAGTAETDAPFYHAVCAPRVFTMFAGQDQFNYALVDSYITTWTHRTVKGSFDESLETFDEEDTARLREVYDTYMAEAEYLRQEAVDAEKRREAETAAE